MGQPNVSHAQLVSQQNYLQQQHMLAQHSQAQRDFEQQQQQYHQFQASQTRVSAGLGPPYGMRHPQFRPMTPTGTYYSSDASAMPGQLSGFNRAQFLVSPAPSPTPSKKKSRMLSGTLGRFFKRNQSNTGGDLPVAPAASYSPSLNPNPYQTRPLGTGAYGSPSRVGAPVNSLRHPLGPGVSLPPHVVRPQQLQVTSAQRYSPLTQQQLFQQQQHQQRLMQQQQQQFQHLGQRANAQMGVQYAAGKFFSGYLHYNLQPVDLLHTNL